MGVLLTATSLKHSSVVTDNETFVVSVLQPTALKMAVEGTVETFGPQVLQPGKPKFS